MKRDINREIRDYKEVMFFGLTMRQFIFSVLAVGVSVGIYFLLKPYVGLETVTWLSVLGAVPFALLGFVSYNGMPAEKLIRAWFRSEILMPKKLVLRESNLFYDLYKPVLERKRKEELKHHDENTVKSAEAR